MAQLVNLGSLCIDNVYRVAHITRPGETIAAHGYARFMGGKGLNQSLAAALAGIATAHVGCVGEDGEELIATLARAGVDTTGIRRLGGIASGHAVIQLDGEGRNAIVITGGANRSIEARDIEAALAAVDRRGWLLLQNEINDLPQVLEAAKRAGVNVAFNIAPADGREQTYDLSGVALVITNEIEVCALTGQHSPDAALETLTRSHPRAHVVVTFGEHGLHYGRGAERLRLPAFAVETVDGTGAGDAFIGYLMATLIEDASMRDALTMASAAGALAAMREGAAASIPTRAQVEEFLAERAGARRT